MCILRCVHPTQSLVYFYPHIFDPLCLMWNIQQKVTKEQIKQINTNSDTDNSTGALLLSLLMPGALVSGLHIPSLSNVLILILFIFFDSNLPL